MSRDSVSVSFLLESLNDLDIFACYGPVASKHGNRRSLLNAGSMAIGRTTGQQWHGVGRVVATYTGKGRFSDGNS